MIRRLRTYQQGGYTAPNPQQMMQEVAQKLQQGEDPQVCLQNLIQSGVPQDQAVQMIQGVMQQLQGQRQEEQQEQPEMQRGGLTDAEARVLYKNPRYVQSAVDAEKRAFVGPPEYVAPQTQLATQYIPDPNAVGANDVQTQIPHQVAQAAASLFTPKVIKKLDRNTKAKVKQLKQVVKATAPTGYVTREAPLPGNFSDNNSERMYSDLENNWSSTPDYDNVVTPGFTNYINNVYNAGIDQRPRQRQTSSQKRQQPTNSSNGNFGYQMLEGAVRGLAAPILPLNHVINRMDKLASDLKSGDPQRLKEGMVGDVIEGLSMGLPFAKIPGLPKAITTLASKIPFSEKIYPYGVRALNSGVRAGMKQLPNAATKFNRTLNATTRGLNAGSKSAKTLTTPFSAATRTFYGGAKGLTQNMSPTVIKKLAQRTGVSPTKLNKIIKNLERMEANYKFGGMTK